MQYKLLLFVSSILAENIFMINHFVFMRFFKRGSESSQSHFNSFDSSIFYSPSSPSLGAKGQFIVFTVQF